MSVQIIPDSVNELFKKYYYDPKFGILSASKFYYRLKDELGAEKFKKLKFTLKQVQDFIKLQQVAQTFRTHQVKKRDEYPIRAEFGPFSKMMIDLLDVGNYARRNDGVTFILTCVDVYTRYAFAQPLQSKSLKDILPSVKAIMNDPIVQENKPKGANNHNAPYVLFIGDNEPAWAPGAKYKQIIAYDEENKSNYEKNNNDNNSNNDNDAIKDRDFKEYFNNNNIQLRLIRDDYKKKSLVERFNKTLRARIETLMATNAGRYIDGLQDLIYSYNNNRHQTIKVTPTRAIKDNKIYDEILYNRVKKLNNREILEPLAQGDFVRTWVGKKHINDNKKANDRGTFAKAKQVWKPDIETVLKVNKDHTYMVTGYDTPFRRSELLKVPVDSAGEPISIKRIVPENPNYDHYRETKKQEKEKTIETRLRGEEIFNSNLPITQAIQENIIPAEMKQYRRESSRNQANARQDIEAVDEIFTKAQRKQQQALYKKIVAKGKKIAAEDKKRKRDGGSLKNTKKMKTGLFDFYYS
jgi:hypothetical protein